MANIEGDTSAKDKRLSVEELDAKLKETPDDLDLKKKLASALVWRYIYGTAEQEPGDEADIKRIREIIQNLPEDIALYPRAYLAYLDGKETELITYLVKVAQQEGSTHLFTSVDLLSALIFPFENSPKLLLKLAGKLVDELNQVHPKSPPALTLRGFVKSEDNPEGAINDFVCALEIDEDFWLAAWWCGSAYEQENNWQAACNYYHKALRSEVAQQMPDIHFDLAWCLGKLKDLQGEEKSYRACLELYPDCPNARNNLGWSLNKQGRYKEALEVFDEAIKRGNDGKFPLRNKAGALIKLGQFQEAIRTLEQDTNKKGELTGFAQKEIVRIRGLIAKQEKGQTLPKQDIEEEVEKDSGEAPPSQRPFESKRRAKSSDDTAFRKERWLEMMLEEMFQENNETLVHKLGRRLRMYNHPEKGYGRQLAIPGVGLIDLLVEDIDTNDLIVIELKRGHTDDQVVGQASRYMTWVRKNLAEGDQKTFGIICVHRASENLKLAAENIPGLTVFEYELNIEAA